MTCQTLRPQGGTQAALTVTDTSLHDYEERMFADICRSLADFQYWFPRMCSRQANGRSTFNNDSYADTCEHAVHLPTTITVGEKSVGG